MMKKIGLSAVAATLLVLVTRSDVQAWRGGHIGYTHVGVGGAYHFGATGFRGGYGGGFRGGYAYRGGFGGAYRGGYGYRGGFGYRDGFGYGGLYRGGYGYGGLYRGGYGLGGYGLAAYEADAAAAATAPYVYAPTYTYYGGAPAYGYVP
jgi:hypothetical protein